MHKVDSLVYLGDSLNIRGSMDETVRAREIKSIGILSQINSILKNVTLGVYYVKSALILRDAMLLNGILTNCESWNYLSVKQIKVFEDADSLIFFFSFQLAKKYESCAVLS